MKDLCMLRFLLWYFKKWFCLIVINLIHGRALYRLPSTGNVYYYVCKLFRSGSDSFSLNSFNDWKTVHRITTHERSDSHLVAVKKGFENAKTHHVDSAIAKQLENEQQYWIELLKHIVSVVTFLAREDTRSEATPNCLGRRTT